MEIVKIIFSFLKCSPASRQRHMRNRKQLIKEMVWKIDKDSRSLSVQLDCRSLACPLLIHSVCTHFFVNASNKKTNEEGKAELSQSQIGHEFQFKFKFCSLSSCERASLDVWMCPTWQ